jgi:hypothetical protein
MSGRRRIGLHVPGGITPGAIFASIAVELIDLLASAVPAKPVPTCASSAIASSTVKNQNLFRLISSMFPAVTCVASSASPSWTPLIPAMARQSRRRNFINLSPGARGAGLVLWNGCFHQVLVIFSTAEDSLRHLLAGHQHRHSRLECELEWRRSASDKESLKKDWSLRRYWILTYNAPRRGERKSASVPRLFSESSPESRIPVNGTPQAIGHRWSLFAHRLPNGSTFSELGPFRAQGTSFGRRALLP